MKIGKRLKESYKSFENSKLFSIEEAVKLVKSNSKAKFDETIDISMNLGVDPRQSDQMVRGMVALPSGTGKDVKVAVFATGDQAEKAKKARKRTQTAKTAKILNFFSSHLARWLGTGSSARPAPLWRLLRLSLPPPQLRPQPHAAAWSCLHCRRGCVRRYETAGDWGISHFSPLAEV